MSLLSTALAAGAFFFVADLVYAVDHYFVHHDRDRYRVTHGRHHRRYNGRKNEVFQLDAYELATYGSAALMSLAITSLVSLATGNVGFFAGAAMKFVHSLLFHLYQHGWWGSVPLRQQALASPRRTWGIASARYHAFHHSHPGDAVFTYAETWAGFDRLLELVHPRLVRLTADARR